MNSCNIEKTCFSSVQLGFSWRIQKVMCLITMHCFLIDFLLCYFFKKPYCFQIIFIQKDIFFLHTLTQNQVTNVVLAKAKTITRCTCT